MPILVLCHGLFACKTFAIFPGGLVACVSYVASRVCDSTNTSPSIRKRGDVNVTAKLGGEPQLNGALACINRQLSKYSIWDLVLSDVRQVACSASTRKNPKS